jgi:hypothetical protein
VKKSILSLFICLPAFLFAQQNTDSSIYFRTINGDVLSTIEFPENKVNISTWFSAFSSSNAMPSAFTNAFIFPNFIDEELKSNVVKRLKSRNTFGGELSSGFAFNFVPDSVGDSKNTALGIIYNAQLIQTAQFSPDLFKLIFKGNASYSDQVAGFNNSGYFAMSYQTLKFSFLQRSENIRFRISAGIARGLSTTQVKLNSGNVYTQSEGEYLDLAWKGNYIQSTNGSNQFKNTPSFGPAIDLSLQVRIQSSGFLSLIVQDLGFINWNQNTTRYERDTSFRFTGVQLSNLLSFSDSTAIIGDTLLNKLRGDQINTSFMQQLPASFQVKYAQRITERWLATGSVQYRLAPGYMPFSSVQLARNFKHNRSIGLTLSYGGYGKFQSGLQAILIQTKHHYLKIGTLFNEGFIAPKKHSGNGITLSYSFSL